MELGGSLQHSQEPTICPYPESDQEIPRPRFTCLKAILILSSHLCLGLMSGLLPLGLPTKILYAPLLFPIAATCPNTLPELRKFKLHYFFN